MIDAAAMLCAAALSRLRARSIGVCASGRAELDSVSWGLARPLPGASDDRLRCLAMMDFKLPFPDMLGGKVNQTAGGLQRFISTEPQRPYLCCPLRL